MSIIIYNQPQSTEPVYSPFFFKVGGFGTSQNPNFRYVFDIYQKHVSASTFSYVATTKLFPNPDGYGIYSPARILENYVSFNINNLFNTGFSKSLESVRHYQVKFSEEWTLTASTYNFTSTTNAGGYVRYNYSGVTGFIVGDRIKIDKFNKAYNSNYDGIQNVLTASTYYVVTDKPYGDVLTNESGSTTYRLTLTSGVTFSGTVINFARQFTERELNIPLTYNISPYVGQPLTNHTLSQVNALGNDLYSSINVTPDDYYQLSWLANGGYMPFAAIIFTYNDLGNSVGLYFMPCPLTSSTANIRFDIGVGPKNLENYSALNAIYLTTDQIYNSAVKTIKVVPALVSGGTYIMAGTGMTLRVRSDCSRYQQYRLAFLNRLGGIDIFRFSRKSTRKINIEREMYTKPLSWNYNLTDRGETTLNVNYQEEITANSNWLTEKEAEIMEELFTSTEVWNVDDSNQLIQPVVVTSKEFINKTVANNKLIQYTITFRFAYKNNLQRN